MNAMISLVAVLALVAISWLGAAVTGLRPVFGMWIPYLAILLFLSGFIYRVVKWARAPVQYRIPTTAGQQTSLSWIEGAKLESPPNAFWTFWRMVLEVLFFRSLFRNTKAELKEGPRLVYGGDKFLWLFALAFHWSFLVIFVRHLRFFTEPVPALVGSIESLDRFFEIGVPALYITDLVILASVGYLLFRRFANAQVKYISLASDYFPLFLILGIAISGVVLRYFAKTDVVGIKEISVGLLSFKSVVPETVGVQFYIHLFLVCTLIGYFPYSKLVHLGGVFLSPTRNLANSNRTERHVNPLDPVVKFHEFEEWEEEFKEEIAEAGYKLERD